MLRNLHFLTLTISEITSNKSLSKNEDFELAKFNNSYDILSLSKHSFKCDRSVYNTNCEYTRMRPANDTCFEVRIKKTSQNHSKNKQNTKFCNPKQFVL